MAAAALILTLLGVLYATWYSDISRATDLEAQPVRRSQDFEQAVAVLWNRAVPLAAASTLDFAVFLPTAWTPSIEWLNTLRSHPNNALDNYDVVQVALVLASVFTLGLAIQSVRQAVALWKHCYFDLRP